MQGASGSFPSNFWHSLLFTLLLREESTWNLSLVHWYPGDLPNLQRREGDGSVLLLASHYRNKASFKTVQCTIVRAGRDK